MSDVDVDGLVKQLLADVPPDSNDAATFLGAQFDAGLAWVHLPQGLGGLGLPRSTQGVVDEALMAAGAPRSFNTNPIGYGMAAPTLRAYATEADLARFLRPIFTGEQIWCQMFSEPGAGSDVASLSTSAVRDGDEWVLNGQKVWTSLAHVASWGLIVARTDPSKPKHAGLTYFFLDMQSAGVDVRPLRQATGDAEFNEVYLTDVRIPDTQRLGAVGEGWKVAITTLMNERVSIGGRVNPRGEGSIADAVRVFRENGRPPEYADRLMQLWVRAEALRLTNIRAREQAKAGADAGPEGSTAKLGDAELNQDIYDFCVDVSGADGLLFPMTYTPPEGQRTRSRTGRDHRYSYLRSMANTIEGGTSEVMRNILAERVLGLPPEPRVDKDMPYSASPR
ncbi:acyl-CoA dehydrogenase family protein [uncultured Jatrophihabitans sp.]|uniref:acyl-CoA dehydrogenase family protein n=1 Tax=uncultured Jatrophihabitans sp. TaxID=1610747 RepID=UPI0035CAF107